MALAALLLAAAAAIPAAAQFAQYTSPGSLGRGPENSREKFEEAVREARWHAGPLRLDPAFWISDLAWYDDPLTKKGDLTARAGIGLRGYLPVGPKTTVAAYALPEYVWWKERSDERRVNQRFGLGVFTYFNRLSIEVTAERDEDFGLQSGDLLQRSTQRTDRLGADLEIPLVRWLSIYANGSQRDVENLAEDSDLQALFSELDRTETSYRAGLRFYLAERFFVGAGVGHAESDSAASARDLSNAGDFDYVEIGYDRPKLAFRTRIERIDSRPAAGSDFAGFEGTTGEARLAWKPREKFRAGLYGARSVSYSLLSAPGESFFVDQRLGLSVGLGLGWRSEIEGYIESGEHRYEDTGGATGRVDDVTSWGGSLRVKLVRELALSVGVRHSEIDAPGSRLDQKLDEITAGLGFGLGRGTWY